MTEDFSVEGIGWNCMKSSSLPAAYPSLLAPVSRVGRSCNKHACISNLFTRSKTPSCAGRYQRLALTTHSKAVHKTNTQQLPVRKPEAAYEYLLG